MSIRSKLRLSAVVTVTLALAVAFTVSLQYKAVGQAARTERFAHGVIKDVSDLNSLSYEYLLLKDKRPGVQWRLKHASLGRVLSEHVVADQEEKALLARLRSNHEQLKSLFDAVSERAVKGSAGAETGPSLYDELNEGITAQLMARAEMMANDAALLGRESARHMDSVRRTSLILVLASGFVLIVSAATSGSLLARSIGGSIRVLERGTQRIAEGDLEHRLGMPANDELGNLARSFDTMTERLQAVTVSKDRLQQEVEQRKQAQFALRTSEQRWATTLSSIGDAVIATDVEGNVTFMNGVAEELTGWTLREASMKPVTKVFNIINEHTRGGVESPVAKVLREGMVVGLANHTVLVKKDGTEVPVDDSGAPIRDADGKTMGVVLVFRDITQRKRAEERTRHLASFPELNPSPVIEVDASGAIIFCNPATQGILKDIGLGDEDCDSLLPEDLEAILQTWDRKNESTLYREVPLKNRVFGETIHLVPQFNVARIYAYDVTDRKRAEEALRESEGKLRLFIEHAPAAIAMFDRAMRYVAVSRRWLTDYRLGDQDIIGRSHYEIFPEIPERWKKVHQSALAGAIQTCDEDPFPRVDGRTDWLRWAVLPWHEQNGDVGGIIISTEDITDRKRADEKLLRAKEEWERTFASVPDMITIIDDQHRIMRVNEAMARRLGCNAEECVGLRCFEAVHGLPEPPDFCPHSRTLKDGLQHLEEVHEDRLGGDFLVSTTPLHDEQGQMIATVHVAHDITERKKVEEALRESERRMARAQEMAHLGSWELDLVNNRLSWSDEVYRIFGLEAQEFGATYDAFLEAVHPEDRAAVDAAYSGSLREGKDTYEIEHRVLRRSSGEVRIVHERCEHLRDETGRIIKSIGMVHDVTERKRAEENLKRAFDELELRVQERTAELQQAYESLTLETRERQQVEAQLRQAQKMEALGTMSGGIAHDFNNILAAVVGFAELLQDRVPKGGQEARHVRRVLEAGLRGRDLVKQMLAFSRKSELEKKPLQLSSVVQEAMKLLRASIPSTISVRVKADSASDLVFADPTQMQQVLMNLCTNATHAMQETGGNLDIELSALRISGYENADGMKPGPYVRLIVRDTGVGIPAGIIDKIFDPFFTTKKVGEGTGLGLSVVHGIVKQHDGYITVESGPGKGSTFAVYLPQIARETETAVVSDDEIPTGTERILFVDDEEALVEMGEDILAELGYEVTSLTNSREGLALLKEDPSRFDLIVTDVTMPGMTGIDLAKEALAIRPGLPIIMCTGHSHLVDADRAKAAGIRAFAMKPLTKREIARTIRKVLDDRDG